jgi:hypothetical protein
LESPAAFIGIRIMVAAVETGGPLLVEAREIVATFQAMVRKRLADAL